MRIFRQLTCLFLVGYFSTSICYAEQLLCDRWSVDQSQDIHVHANPCMQRFLFAYHTTKEQQAKTHDQLYHLPIIRTLAANRLLA